jgi:hypothetical protein
MSTFEEEQEQVVYENKLRSETEVKQMLRDAIDKDPEGTVWHVNTKHLMTFAQMVADKTRREMSSPTKIMGPNLEAVLNSAGFYKKDPNRTQEAWDEYIYEQGEPPTSIKEKLDMIAPLDAKGYAIVKGLGDVVILSEDVGGLTFVARWVRSDSITDRTEEFYWGKESDDGAEEKQDSKEDQRKADEAAWSDARIACAAIRDAELEDARDDAALVTAAYSNYVTSCVAIDDAARVGARAYCTEEEEPRAQHMSTPFDRHWLEMGACVPVDIETMAALVSEIHRLMAIIEVVTAKLKEKNA